MNITHASLPTAWQDLSTSLQLQMAEVLDRYAAALEAGDELAAENILGEHPDWLPYLSGHLESLQLLCRATHRVAQPAPIASEKLDRHAADFSVLGDYRIEREIGRGGMGIVYEATQLSLRRNVALKVLPFAAVLDQKQVARFRNEAQAAASLHHPHIVPVYAVGCERGVHYYSMQLIDGQTLEQTLKEIVFQDVRGVTLPDEGKTKRLAEHQRVANDTTLGYEDLEDKSLPDTPPAEHGPASAAGRTTLNSLAASATTVATVRNRDFIRTTVELVISVADALDYAHQQGVVHRDIKPSNLLVDGLGKIWVADFGLARCRGVGNLTAQGNVIGTARYMSPEQVAGRSHEIDHRTDIYSLGITLYELLTLQAAFSANDRESLFKAVESDEPISPRRLNPAISVDLETILFKSIAKRKDERYATAGEFAEDLRRYLDGRPTLARRPTTLDRAFKWAVRRQRVVCAALLIMVAAMFGLTLATVLITRQSTLKDLANQQARLHLDQAHHVVDRFGGLMLQRLNNLPGTATLRAELLREAERYYVDFSRYAHSDRSLQAELARVQFRLGAIYVQLGDTRAAEEKYLASAATFEKLHDPALVASALQADYALCLHNLAALRKEQGRYTDALGLYRQAVALQLPLLKTAAPEPRFLREWAATQTNFGTLQWECAEAQEASQRLRDTRQRLEAYVQHAPGDLETQQQLIESRNALVAILIDDDQALAEQLLRANISQLQAWGTLEHAPCSPSLAGHLSPACQLAIAQNNLAMLLGRQLQFTEALQLVRHSIETLQQAAAQYPEGPSQQQLAIAHNNLGQLLWSRGPDAQAGESFSAAEAIFRREISARSPTPETLSRLGGVLHNQGALDQHQGDLDNAVQNLTEAMELQALAIRQAPLNHGYRKYLELHRELLDRVLRQIHQQTEAARESPKVAATQNVTGGVGSGQTGGY